MSHPRPLTESPRYEDFVKGRDKELERILGKYLTAFNIILGGLNRHCADVARAISTTGFDHYNARKNRQVFTRRIDPWFDIATRRSAELLTQLRKTVYVLSYIGQAEAIGRATGLRQKYHLDKGNINRGTTHEMTHGGSIDSRMELAFTRLKTDVTDAFHTSQVMESPLDETIDRINRAFPGKKKIKRISKLIAPMRESDFTQGRGKNKIAFSFGVIDESEWADIVDDYMSDEIPFGRAPEDKIFLGGKTPEGEDEFVYQWQVEQEVTDDFVAQVRRGEIDAANENGINDFQWIAITDKKTDDCCLVRDGLSSQEIQDKLDSGDIDDDDCDSIVPPGHFNCRCRAAPISKDMPEVAPPDFGGFDEWMQERAEAGRASDQG